MTDKTFFIHLNGTVEVGPALPTVLAEHCAISLHDGNVMILGKTRSLKSMCRPYYGNQDLSPLANRVYFFGNIKNQLNYTLPIRWKKLRSQSQQNYDI